MYACMYKRMHIVNVCMTILKYLEVCAVHIQSPVLGIPPQQQHVLLINHAAVRELNGLVDLFQNLLAHHVLQRMRGRIHWDTSRGLHGGRGPSAGGYPGRYSRIKRATTY